MEKRAKRAKTKATKNQMQERVIVILRHLSQNVYASQKDMLAGIAKLPEFATIRRSTIRDYLRRASKLIDTKQMRDRAELVRRILTM